MLTRIRTDITDRKKIDFWLLHESSGASVVSGNKRFKLNPAVRATLAGDYQCMLSFGGAYSNHIHALAVTAHQFGVGSVGIIRGEPEYALNPTLADARRAGMRLEFVTRSEYRQRNDPQWLAQLKLRYPNTLIIPEGGSTLQAARACAGMLDPLERDFLRTVDVLACAVGTGATLSGLHSRLEARQQAYGFMVVPDASVHRRVKNWIGQLTDPDDCACWRLVDAHFPGYAKLCVSQYKFIDRFFTRAGVLLDPVYTGKMVNQLMHLVMQGDICAGSTVLVVHTGGLQGWRGKLVEASQHLSAATLDAVHNQMQ